MKAKKKQVLIALDYDPTAQKVANEGFALAKAMNADVILLHVISDILYYYSPEYSPIMGLSGEMVSFPIHAEGDVGLRKAAQDFLDKSKRLLGDKTIKTVIKEGNLADSILNTAKDLHIDIIVMGSHSRKWLEKIVMGSVTESVLNQTNRPLFIVPTRSHK